MKKLLIIIFLLICCSCSHGRPHRPEFYQTPKGEKWIDRNPYYGAGSLNQRYLSIYPECSNKNISEGDFYECIREIDVKEGRVKK
jgi:hypothetical protein